MQQFMFTDILIWLSVSVLQMHLYGCLIPHPWAFHIKMSQIADFICPFWASRILSFWRKHLLFGNQNLDCFLHSTFCLKKQSGRASTHADVSSGLRKRVEGRILCCCCKLLVSKIIMFKYKLLLSCC